MKAYIEVRGRCRKGEKSKRILGQRKRKRETRDWTSGTQRGT